LISSEVGSVAEQRWPTIVLDLLSGDPKTGLSRALTEAGGMAGADGVALVEWVAGGPSEVHRYGSAAIPARRPRAGVSAGLAVVRVDAQHDLIATAVDGRLFAPADVAGLRAVARLLAQASLTQRQDAAETLQRLSLEIVGTLDLDRVLLSIANAAARLLSSALAGVFLVDPPGVHPPEAGELRMQCIVGHRRPESTRLRIPAGQGIAGQVLLTGKPVRVDVYHAAAITKTFSRHAMEEGTRSGMAVPLRDTAGMLIGVLSVWRRRPSVWSDADEALLVSLGRLAAIGLVNAGLYTAQQQAVADAEAARAELARRLEFSDASLAIHRRLTEIAAQGQDLVGLASAVQEFLGGTVLIAPDGDRPLVQWPPATRGRPVLPRERDVIDVVDLLDRPAPAGGGGPRWIRVAIGAAGRHHGAVYARPVDAPTLRDTVTLEQSATICALLLGQDAALAAAAARLRAEFVWALLDGRVEDTGMPGRARALGLRVTYPARVLLVRVDGLAGLGRAEGWTTQQHEQYRDWLVERLTRALSELTGDEVPAAARDADVVALLPEALGAADRIAAVVEGCSPFPTVRLPAGLSRPTRSAQGLPQALHEARMAVSAVDLGTGPVVAFEDLGVLQFLLGPGGAEQLNHYAQAVLGRLLAYDQRHGTDLLATLDAYFEQGANTAATARALRLHPKSLAYRLRRITEVGELDLADRRTRLDVELALRIIGPARRLRERVERPELTAPHA
jgi:sugar diacid utilization regulator/GAF domain-containing protein